MEKSRLTQQLKELPGAMLSTLATLRQQGAQIDAKYEKAWVVAVQTAYSTVNFLTIVDQGLQKLLTAEDRKFLLAHYDSPLGRRITELEIKASQPKAEAEIQAHAQELMADLSKHVDRLALYREIDQAAGTTAVATEIAVNVAVATAIGVRSALQGPQNVDASAFRAQMEQMRPVMTQQIDSGTLVTMAYAYRDMEIKDLNAYLTYLNSPSAKKFNMGVGKLLGEALASKSQEFGDQLVKNLGRKGI